MNKEEGMRILKDLQAIQSELELVRVHCIELQKLVLMYSDVERLE